MKLGKVKRKAMLSKPMWINQAPIICPLCDRAIPPDHTEAHHLVPKSKGGTQTQLIHSACHRQIHALISESDLATTFNTIEALKSHSELSKFISWIKKKPNDFKERVRKSKQLKYRS
jgi:hypothetical protein